MAHWSQAVVGDKRQDKEFDAIKDVKSFIYGVREERQHRKATNFVAKCANLH